MPASNLAEIFESFHHQRYNLNYMLDKLPIATAIIDNEGTIIYYNQAQSHMDGIEASEAVGKKETDIYDFIQFPDVHKICQRRCRPILGFVWPYRTKYGKTINAAYWVFPLFRNNLVVGSLCFTQPLATAKATGVKIEKKSPIEWPDDTPISMAIPKLVGGNLDFQRAVDTARSTASSPSQVLIAGETGTGKELFARFIHENSGRADQLFMAINCAAIPDNLLEGLLFGTVKGSFTGAVDRAGLFEEANGGTLFLDEIDSMPLELQPKLLRVLQEMRSRRIGSSNEVVLNIKIISSVGGSLVQALNNGRLRPDLFYRLAVIVIEIPPLRQRLDDLEALLNYFINKYNKQLGTNCCKFSETVMRLFHKYNWPGNVRELEHLVAGTINLAHNNEVLDFYHLPVHYQRMFTNLSQQDAEKYSYSAFLGQRLEDPACITPFATQDSAAFQAASSVLPGASLKSRAPASQDKPRERDILVEALAKSKGNVAQAARQLGLSRQLLAYRMKKNDLNREDYILDE